MRVYVFVACADRVLMVCVVEHVSHHDQGKSMASRERTTGDAAHTDVSPFIPPCMCVMLTCMRSRIEFC